MNGNRAFVVPVIIYWLAGGAALSQCVPNWRVWHLWDAKPPTAALIQAQAALETSKSEAKMANDALNAARDAETARKASQLVYGSQMTYGASKALESAPVSPQTALAVSLLNRSNAALTSALGSLPQDKANEILLIVSQSLSGAADQLAQANATLAIRDKELAVATAERSALQARLPGLESAVEAKQTDLATQTLKVQETTQQVVTYAEKLAAKEKENGGLGALVGNLWRTIQIMGVLGIIGYGLFLWVRYKFGGFPKAMAAGINELRSKGALPPKGESNVFDAFLNRHEQIQVGEHTQ